MAFNPTPLVHFQEGNRHLRKEGPMTAWAEIAASTSQGLPAAPGAGRGKEGFPLQVSGECRPADTLDSDFQPPELSEDTFLWL